ncbi:hypothetical protein NC651_001352 [Populus alba x Populus x berolinensis]|nr:hypothetical protein NC651_001352 [Populus alba x Populus x berolinensis]
MILEEQLNESALQSVTTQRDVIFPLEPKNNTSNGSENHMHPNHKDAHKDALYIAKVIHPFDAQAEGELSLFIDDFVVVRQVAPTGWSEGECKGKAGWFPSAYIEKHETAPASKIMEESSTP